MLADAVRTRAYLAAIAHEVRAGDVVVEIGTGVGYFAVAAARAGARQVYAIESAGVADVAREVIADNGVTDRVTVIHGDALQVVLPARGTVLLEDIRSVLPMHGARFALLADARARHLTPDARWIAQRDLLWAAPVVEPDPAPNETAAALLGDTPYGIDRGAVERRLRSDWRRVRLSADALLAEPALLASVDLATVSSPHVEGSAEWLIARDGVLDGFAVWFDAELAGGARISNAPAAPRALYGQAHFPLTSPLVVHGGDRVQLEWRALSVADGYVFAWHTRHTSKVTGRTEEFRQSTLGSSLPPREQFPLGTNPSLRHVDGAGSGGVPKADGGGAHS